MPPSADEILRKVRTQEAGLRVMGAEGLPVPPDSCLGSMLRMALEQSLVAVYCYH